MKAMCFFSCLILLVSLSCSIDKTYNLPQGQKDGIFLHVSHGTEDPHRVLMALNMADMMSPDKDVLVYFDIKGIEVVLKDAPDLTYKHFPSSQTLISNLLEKGIPILACPGCLKAAGKIPEDLMPGIKVAEKELFFNFTAGRILTLDY